jgi:dimethylamine/trimethylamine dehydrogenase
VVLFDDDHYYMGGVLAELLAKEGHEVQLVTPASQVSAWTANTLEITKVNRRVLEAGVTVHCNAVVTSVRSDHVVVASAYTARETELAADSVVMVTARLPEESLLLSLTETVGNGLASVRGIGDAWAPGTIAAAVWSGWSPGTTSKRSAPCGCSPARASPSPDSYRSPATTTPGSPGCPRSTSPPPARTPPRWAAGPWRPPCGASSSPICRRAASRSSRG